MMSQKHAAFTLMALGSICVMFTSSAGAVPPERTQEDVQRIVAQQKAELEADGKRIEESETYPFFSRFQSPAMRPVKDVELRTAPDRALPPFPQGVSGPAMRREAA